jgi:hypothetical protein
VRQAALIAIVDTSTVAPDNKQRLLLSFNTTVKVREVLKGEGETGQEFTLTQLMRADGPHLPREAQGVAVLLSPRPDGQSKYLQQCYTSAEDIAALRAMVRIIALPSERERLLALREKSENPIFRDQLASDLRDMREPANFSLLLDMMREGSPQDQVQAAEIMTFIGDKRGVPALIEAMKSPRRALAITAANALMYSFADAPGVDAAFRSGALSQELAVHIQHYLAAHGGPPLHRNLYQTISDLRGKGDEASARKLFPQALREPEHLDSLVLYDTDWLVRMLHAHPKLQTQARSALLPILARYAADDKSYHNAVASAKILRALNHADADVSLLSLLRPRGEQSWLFDESTRIAAFALTDKGGDNKLKAIAALSQRPDWPSLAPLFASFTTPKQEADALAQQLAAQLQSNSINDTQKWILYRLSELRAPSTVGILAQWMGKRAGYGEGMAGRALTAIGGARVEAEMLKLLGPEFHAPAGREALQVLAGLQREKALPLLRRIVQGQELGPKSDAVTLLGGLGTRQDITLLLPLSDFWTGDRSIHYSAQDALRRLRQRYSKAS